MNTPLPKVTPLNGAKAIFLLGTDQYIGEGLDEDGEVTRAARPVSGSFPIK